MIDAGEYKDKAMERRWYSGPASNGGNNIVKVGTGFLHSITLAQLDAAPTAGAICIYDSVAVYGTVASIIFLHTQTTAVFMPVTIALNVPFVVGLGVGIAMADVGVTLSFK